MNNILFAETYVKYQLFTTGVFILYLFSFLEFYFFSLRPLNSGDNMSFILPKCVIGISLRFRYG